MLRTAVRLATALCLLGAVSTGASAHHRRHHGYHLAGTTAHVLQCVAFAKSASDVMLHGNAVNWWHNAEGVYARGTAPEVGSVLNFRANARMRLGHVAVVTQIVDSRTIRIDQSHWNANGISRDVSVIDVSPNNDWSAVRVAIARAHTFGSIYPTFGFIYPRPDTTGGRVITARSDAAVPEIGDAPSDLRRTEVAAAPDDAATTAIAIPLATDAPNRSLQ